jgi:cytochrome c2
MRTALGCGVWLLVAGLSVGSPVPAGAEESAGKAVFLAEKCNLCHSVETAGIEAKTTSEKMKGGDLSTATTRHEDSWIAQYIRKQIQKDEKDHKKEFKGSDEELQALIGWLKEQAVAAKS